VALSKKTRLWPACTGRKESAIPPFAINVRLLWASADEGHARRHI
jgi:hypothetical protein